MDETITYRGTVYPWHCDHMGHMNVMWYVGKFDEAVWNLFNRLGITPSYLRGTQRGIAALEQTIRYKRELRAGDVVAVRSVVTGLRDKVVLMRQALFNVEQGFVAATMDVVGVHMDTQARKAVPFPTEIAARIRAELARQPARPVPCPGGHHAHAPFRR
jgi:acyl-CoA thioester hydrolase